MVEAGSLVSSILLGRFTVYFCLLIQLSLVTRRGFQELGGWGLRMAIAEPPMQHFLLLKYLGEKAYEMASGENKFQIFG